MLPSSSQLLTTCKVDEARMMTVLFALSEEPTLLRLILGSDAILSVVDVEELWTTSAKNVEPGEKTRASIPECGKALVKSMMSESHSVTGRCRISSQEYATLKRCCLSDTPTLERQQYQRNNDCKLDSVRVLSVVLAQKPSRRDQAR